MSCDMTDVTVVGGVCLVTCQDSTTLAGGELRLPQSTLSTCSQRKSASLFVCTRT